MTPSTGSGNTQSDAPDIYFRLTPRERREIAARLASSVLPITDPRFDARDLCRALWDARGRRPDSTIHLLMPDETFEAIGGQRAIDAEGAWPGGVVRVTATAQLPPGPVVVVLALPDDPALSRAARALQDRPQTEYYGLPIYYPCARFAHRDPVARRVLLEQAALSEPKFNLDDFEGIMQCLWATRSIAGAYAEIGVYRGRSARAACAYMREAGIQRPVLLADTYEGFSYPQARHSPDALWAGTHTQTDLDEVKRFVDAGDHAEFLRLNIITDDLPARYDPIAVCNIDVDLYEAVLAAAHRVAPRLAVGGILIFEDPGHTPALAGALAAVDAFFESTASRGLTRLTLPSGQTLAIRHA